MNNPCKGRHADPNEKVNIRPYAVSRYKVLQALAVKIRKKDRERWQMLMSPPLNKWTPQDGTTQTKKPQDRPSKG